MAKLQTFNRKTRKVSGFLTVCKLYIRIRIKEIVVKEQIQWVLLYIQEESADICKEKILEDFGGGHIGICNDRGVFGRFEKRIQ